MLISCRFSIVGHLLLLSHIVHSFVLLTANVDDVKKIAQKFVSDSLAEKIADFIARATETMAHNKKVSEENENSADGQESSQVSAENRMYNLERHALDSQAAETKSKEEIVLEKVTTVKPQRKTSAEKKRKHKKEPKPLHGRSRYIVQSENRASVANEKVELSKKDKYNKMEESIQLIKDNLFSTPNDSTKTKKPKKSKSGSYKLVSGFDTVKNDAAKNGTAYSKEANNDDKRFNLRAREDEKVLSLPTEEAATEIEQHVNEGGKEADKALSVLQHEVKDENNTEKVATNEALHFTGKDEFDHDENKIIETTDKVSTTGSRDVMKRDVEEENWWERPLPAYTHEVYGRNRKSWF